MKVKSIISAVTTAAFIVLVVLYVNQNAMALQENIILTENIWSPSNRDLQSLKQNLIEEINAFNPLENITSQEITNPSIAFIHTQKVGGTYFEQVLISNIIGKSCQVNEFFLNSQKNLENCSVIDEKTEPWLLARPTISWPCGTHASFSAIENCLPQWLDQTYGKGFHRHNVIFGRPLIIVHYTFEEPNTVKKKEI